VSEAEDQLASQRKQLANRTKISQEALGSHTSYWPFALAVALIIVLLGIMTHPILFSVGVVLVAAAAIGWGLEKR